MSRIEITPIGAPSLLSITGRWRKLPATMSERQSATGFELGTERTVSPGVITAATGSSFALASSYTATFVK